MKHERQLHLIADVERLLHPEARLQDWCKLFFQARYGPGHMVSDADAAHRMLLGELEDDLNTGEPLWQPIGADYGRLHLGPWKAQGLPTEPLLQAFLSSAAVPVVHDVAAWPADWKPLAQWLMREGFARPDDETRVRVLSLPVESSLIHHSEAYRRLYNPHYRVLFTDNWIQLKMRYNLGG
ncbi:MAG: hypothetical protein K8R90_04380 [Candidatus Cloacimonetes bacterium]|nr:hypothetical protein [Candidatus Cloacimonadota bacterium]